MHAVRGRKLVGGRVTAIVTMTVLVVLFASAAMVWSAQAQFRLLEAHQRGLSGRSAESVAREITTLLGEMRRGIRLFVEEQPALLSAQAGNRDDRVALTRIEALLDRYFPDRYAFTLADPSGEIWVDDFGAAVGDLCRHDIQGFAVSGKDLPVIHPGPGVYHFDLMVPWRHAAGQWTFFLSFKADRLAGLLASAQLPGERLLLVRRDQPNLIEVDDRGSRDRFGERTLLDAGEIGRIDTIGARADVRDTAWRVVSLPDESVHRSFLDSRNLRIATTEFILFLAGGMVIVTVLWGERRRRLDEEQLRLAGAVFNSAQEGMAITDLNGRILAINRAFTTITEYGEAEVLGKTPRMLQSGRQDRDFYLTMWRDLQETGFWQGEIWNRRKSGEIYLEWLTISSVRGEDGLPERYVAIYTDISRINHAQSQLEHLAQHDALTDLPNRLLLRSRLEHVIDRARRAGERVAVLYLDLDHFKEVNDGYGHAAGDELLQQVARVLSD
ncbi:MAG: diguanylate cyclase, partial [Thiobacillus sp.]|nr:diguanylate cyclase [Thiobacillus sp.]